MPSKAKLSPSMTEQQFDKGYWYALEVKQFANRLGIPSANRLRKDELEKAIKVFFENWKNTKSYQKKSFKEWR